MSRGEGYQLGYRDGVRAAITWLHARADSMDDPDPKVKALLNSAATNLGWELDARGKLAAKRRAASPAVTANNKS